MRPPDTWARVEGHLDAYADAWVAARTDACEATHRGEQSPALLDLRMACLDERRTQLNATVEELAHADAKLVGFVVRAEALHVAGLRGSSTHGAKRSVMMKVFAVTVRRQQEHQPHR